MNKKKLPNIQLTFKADGRQAFAVCTWHESANYYMAPLDSNERKITGCTAQFGRTLKEFTKYTKKQAYSRATTLFGYARIARG